MAMATVRVKHKAGLPLVSLHGTVNQEGQMSPQDFALSSTLPRRTLIVHAVCGPLCMQRST